MISDCCLLHEMHLTARQQSMLESICTEILHNDLLKRQRPFVQPSPLLTTDDSRLDQWIK